MQAPHDRLFQFTFRHARHATGWLQALLPAVLTAAVDWAQLAPASDRLPGQLLRRNEADGVLQAPLVGDDRSAVFVLEHHTGPTARWTEQLLRYVVHLRRVLWKRNRKERTFVVPIVLWVRPRDTALPNAAETNELDTVLQQLQPQLQPVVHDLTQGDEAGRRDPRLTPLAQLTLCCLATLPGSDVESALAALDRWGDLLHAVGIDDGPPHPEDALEAIAWYVLEVTEVSEEQLHMAFAKHVPTDPSTRMTTANKLRLEGRLQGLAQGKAEGKAEGKADTLQRLLHRRFGPLAEATQQQIRSATVDQLDRWFDALLDARSLTDVLAVEPQLPA